MGALRPQVADDDRREGDEDALERPGRAGLRRGEHGVELTGESVNPSHLPVVVVIAAASRMVTPNTTVEDRRGWYP